MGVERHLVFAITDRYRLARPGMVTDDSCRPGRLAVDTGWHARGWTRQHADGHLRDNTTMADIEI